MMEPERMKFRSKNKNEGRGSVRSSSFTILLMLLLLLISSINVAHAWEWSDLVWLGGGNVADVTGDTRGRASLSYSEIRELRVREIKRRLALHHGYDNKEIAKMLDKSELMEALSYEEHKIKMKTEIKAKRWVLWRSAIATLLAALFGLFYPLLFHVYEVAAVNWVVYLDKKKYEANRCMELKSAWAFIGILAMAVLDLLQVWLSVSILASWVISSISSLRYLSKYLFPTPNLPFRPAAYMGGEISKSQYAQYGLNVGPMVLTWFMRFIYGRIENWTGQALRNAQHAQRREETPEERIARKAAKKAAKRAAKEQAAAMAAAAQRDELNRRKQMADKATAELFSSQPRPHPGAMRSRSGFNGNAEAEGDMTNDDLDGWDKEKKDEDGDDIVDTGTLRHEDARRAFQQQVEEVDMDDLD